MNKNTQPNGRRDARLPLTGNQAVTITFDGDRHPTPLGAVPGRILDLSECGIGLEVDDEIPLSNTLRLSFRIVELALDLHVSGRVCWSRQDDQGGWQVGCSLCPPLPRGLLKRLAEARHSDKRGALRHGFDTELSIQTEFSESAESGRLRNYSRGGFCVATRQPTRTGQRLYACLREAEVFVIVGVVQWKLQSENDFLVGCSFRDSGHFDRLHSFCERRKVSEQLLEASA